MDRVKLPLFSVFNTDPLAVLALRIRHAAGCQWAVVGDTLTLVTPNLTWSTNLAAVSLGGLINLLVAEGFEVAYQNDDLLHLSALVLLEGTGNQADSNGDQLTAYTAPLTVMQAAMGRSLAAGRDSVPHALAQMILPDATAEWADLFGTVFGVPRENGLLPYQVANYTLANDALLAEVYAGLALIGAAADGVTEQAAIAANRVAEVESYTALACGSL